MAAQVGHGRLGGLAVALAVLSAGCAGGSDADASLSRSPAAAARDDAPEPIAEDGVRDWSIPGEDVDDGTATTEGDTGTPARNRVALPASIAIPGLDVTSDLVRLGLNDDGTMQVPSDFDRAGWYLHGPRPGELGPAVIAGHVDSATGPAVFHRLDTLEVGDHVEVLDAHGTTRVFAVESVERYPKDGFPTEHVYGDLDYAALRLITCAGEFHRAAGRYLENLIVTASLVQ